VIGQRAKWLLIGLFILWIFFVLASFFLVQKPFLATNVLAVGNVLLDLLTAIWLALVALGIGSWFLEWLLPLSPSPLSTEGVMDGLETIVLGAGLGLGALGLFSLGLGLLGLFRPAVAYGVTLALSAIFVPQLVRLFQRWRHWRFTSSPSPLPIVYCLLIFLWTSLVALLPPTDWDGLFYHLNGPKLYLQAGRIVGGMDIPHLNFPSLMEMFYTWAMLLRGDIAAKLLHTLFGLLLAGLVYLTARRFLSKKAGWLAVVAFASMPMVSTLAGWAYNDLALAFYQLASLYIFVKYQIGESGNQGVRESGNQGIGKYPTPALHAGANVPNTHYPLPKGHDVSDRRWLVLSGIFAGLAMGLKYTGFVTPVVVGGLILWHAYRVSRFSSHGDADLSHRDASLSHTSRFTGFADFAIFSLSALLAALPWYAKNWAFTGNPVYPFLSGWFDGRYWDGFRADWYAAAGTGIGWRPGTLLALPWLLTLGVRDVNYWDGRTGPLFLLFLPLILLYGLFRYRRNAPDRPFALDPLLIYALAQFGVWTLGVVWSRSLWQSRLLLPCLAALAPVVGWLWADLPRFDLRHFSLSRFVNLTIGLALVLTLVDVGLLTLKINPLPYLTGGETRDEYLIRRLGAHYAVMGQINETLPPDAVIVFLWEPRSYFCQRDCRPDSILDKFPHLVHQHGSADAIARTWQQAGITHVLIHRTGLNFVLNDAPEAVDTAVLTELETHHLRLLFETTGAYQVYALEPAP
jgi:hypothetical protein